MAVISRATAHTFAAIAVGGLLAAFVATALSLSDRSAYKVMAAERGAVAASGVSRDLEAIDEAARSIDVAERPISAAETRLIATAGPADAASLRVVGAASWRIETQGRLRLETAFAATDAETDAFTRAAGDGIETLERDFNAARGLLDAEPKRVEPSTIAELALYPAGIAKASPRSAPSIGPVALADPGGDRNAFWLAWTDVDGARRSALKLELIPSGAIPSIPHYETTLTFADADDRGAALPLAAGPIEARRPVDGVIGGLAVAVIGPTMGLADLEAAQLAPALLIGVMVGAAQFLLLRAERRRSSRSAARHKATMRNVALKQRELEASEARFKRLAESTNVVPWNANLDTQRFSYVGPQIEDMTGYPTKSWYASGFWTHHIHPDDRRRVLIDEISSMPHNTYHTIEYRIRAADGRILHIRNMLTIARKLGDDDARGAAIAQGFLLDVTDMKRAEATLEEARQKAEDANRVKSEFLANMSHELRTPLNAVIGFSEIMKDEVFGPIDAQYREYAESIHTSGRHLLDLINDVLDLSKIEAGRIDLAEEETDVGELLLNCVRLLQERISSAGLHHALEVEVDLPTLVVDERRLKQILLNLISNAVKFTPPGGSITVWAKRARNGGVLIAVRDTGVGMSAEEIPRALAKFGQIDGELARKHDGTGLGLPIAKSLIELHGGDLNILSEKGKGTEVRLWLPDERLIGAA